MYKRKRINTKPYQRAQRRKGRVSGKATTLTLPGVVSLRSPVTGFPTKVRARLRYADIMTLTSSNGSLTGSTFRMNSVYDPDYTNVGHQPYYFDQFAALYGRYAVQGAKLTAKFSIVPSTTSTSQPSGPVICAVLTDNDATLPAVLSTMMENQNSVSDVLCNQTGGNNVKVLSKTYSPKKNLGVEPFNDSQVALITGNPSREWFGSVMIAEVGASTSTTVQVKIEIVYDVIFSELKDVTGS